MDQTYDQAFRPIFKIKTAKEYEEEIEQLRSENFNLKSKMAQSTEHKQNGNSDDYTKVLIDAKTSINILENENENLKHQNENLKNQIENLKSYVKNGNDFELLQEENIKLVKYVEKLNEDFNKERNKLEHVENEKNNFYNELCDLKEEMGNYEELKNELMEMKNRNIQNENEYKRFKEQLSLEYETNLRIEKQKLSGEYDDKINKITNEFEALKGSYNALKEQNLQYKNQINHGNAQFNIISNENKALKVQLENDNNKYKEILERDDIQKKSNILKIESLNEQLKKEKIKNEELLSLNQLLEEENNVIKNNIENDSDKLRSDFNMLKKENLHLLKEISRCKNEIGVLTSSKNDTNKLIKEKILNYEKQVNELTLARNDLEERYSKALNENKQTEEKLMTLQKSYYEKLKNFDEKENYKNKYENSNNFKIMQLEKEISDFKNKEMQYKKEINEFEIFKNKLMNQITKFTTSIAQLEKRYIRMINILKVNFNSNRENKEKIKILELAIDEKNQLLNNKNNVLSLSEKNRNFLKEFAPRENTLNGIVNKFSFLYDELRKKLAILEAESRQLTFFAENKIKGVNTETISLIEKFSVEFRNAKEELQFCKDYLKKKGIEIKELKKNKEENSNRIIELEKIIKEMNVVKEKPKSKSMFSIFR